METRQWRNQQTATKAIDERLTSIEKSLAHLNYLIDPYQGTPINRLIWKLSGFPSVEEFKLSFWLSYGIKEPGSSLEN